VWPVVDKGTTGSANDQLFRNVRGQSWNNATVAAAVVEPGFSQGIAAGDWDADGFPDIVVANAGISRLFHNLGDGTFADVTATSGLPDAAWTTSVLIADFSGDGFDDVLLVNYLSLADASAELCHDGNKLRRCDAKEFHAEPDTLLINAGDGSFIDVSHAAGLAELPDGRGLGAVAADFNDDGALDVFVANDAVPNFLLLQDGPVTSLDSRAPPLRRFRDAALEAGVAVDANGVPQACMGIALSDFDGNMRPDLFVTNFLHESNTMYLGLATGLYVDRTSSLQLSAPSLEVLGFGTQALDADLDGDDDLVVVNGHLDDLSAAGVPYRMPAHVYENAGGREFSMLPAAGDFFSQPHLGRTLAVLDWNRDGRPDLAAGLLQESSVVLENTSPVESSSLQLRLVGTRSSRLASGSRVTVTGGSRVLRRWLGTGGFQAANEPLTTVALGDSSGTLVTVEVTWPDGRSEQFGPLSSSGCVTLVEGAGRRGGWSIPR
jgi:hypothetical protein